MMAIITGNQNPRVGETNYYNINSFSTVGILATQYEWHLYKKQKNGDWKNITGTPKKGHSVPYTFFEVCLGVEMRIEVHEIKNNILQNKSTTRKVAELIVIPTSSKIPKILKVTLFNRGSRDINKASYADTLIAQAHCVGLFFKEIEFHLWEDDAPKGGHNTEINKNNRAPRTYRAIVNERGIAEAKISLAADEKILRQIANKYMMNGDQNEGANHEYYVTASYSGKVQSASQVNVSVTNPDNKPKPKEDSPKYPVGNGNIKQRDTKGKIRDAYFVNEKGEKISKIVVGKHVKVRLLVSDDMVGKHFQYVVWEYDAGKHDEIYKSGRIKIPGTVIDTTGFTITKEMFNKGVDFSNINIDPDSEKQNYFLEIIPLDVSAESARFGVDSNVGLMEVEKTRSPSIVREQPKQEKKEEDEKNEIGKCYCYLQGIVEKSCNGKGNAVTDKHFESLAKDIGVESKVFKAVAVVESGGRKSFIDVNGEQKAKILYERHYMYRFLNKIKSQSELDTLKKDSPDLVHNIGTYKDKTAKYGSEKEQFAKLDRAKKIDNDSAIKSCSWGKFQVMGKYYNYLYESPNEMEEAMHMCEVQHFAYFKVYLKDVSGAPMIKAMKDKNWNKIAELYNGSDYAINKYHTKMKNEYEKQ